VTNTRLTKLPKENPLDTGDYAHYQVELDVYPPQTFNLRVTGFMVALPGQPPATVQDVADTIAETDAPDFWPHGYIVSADCGCPTLRAVVEAAATTSSNFRRPLRSSE
jgi:hypothetical protein